MKAFVLNGLGKLDFEDVEKPVPQSGEVLVKVKAAGICGSDIPRIYQTGAYHYPLIPGHEFSGIVTETSEDVSDGWEGKRVGIFPLIPCRSCSACSNRQYELCRNYDYLGSRRDGGFAEYVCVPEWNLIELPYNVTYIQAAMLEPMAVAMHAIRRAYSGEIREKTVAICGLGTIGFLLFLLLRERVGNVLLIGNKDSQRAALTGLGGMEDHYFDSRSAGIDEWLKERSNGLGADIFFDCTGRSDAVSLGMRSSACGGKVMLVGNPAGNMNFFQQDYWKILRNQLTLLGTWNSSFSHDVSDDWNECLKLLEQEAVCPERLITHRFPLKRLREGTKLMRDKREPYIKIIVNPEEEDNAD